MWFLTSCAVLKGYFHSVNIVFLTFFFYFALFGRTSEINTLHLCFILVLRAVLTELRCLPKYFPRQLFGLSLFQRVLFVLRCRLGRDDDTVSDALCKIYALSWRC